MTDQVSKTVDHFRDEYRQLRTFCLDHDANPNSVPRTLEHIVMESLAATGSPALFDEADDGVRRRVLRHLRFYKRTGRLVTMFAHSGRERDDGPIAHAAIKTLAAAGVVSRSMAQIATPRPKLMGLEWIEGIAPLRERLLCDDTLLDVELVALAQRVPNPRAYPDTWTVSLQLTEHARRDIDAHTYERIEVRSCVATFALRGRVGMYFWPRFSFGHVSRLRVIREAQPRGQNALVVKLDMDGKGRLSCREMALLRIEEISCNYSDQEPRD